MCFSAYASFAAAGALTTVGYFCQSGKSRKEDPYFFLRQIPWIFAAQQALEGGVWLTLGSSWAHLFGMGFLFFAMVVWPIWFPLSLWHAEANPQRKTAILCILALAGCYALYNTYIGITHTTLVGTIDHSLRYTTQEGFNWRPYLTYFYLGATFSPFLFTTRRWLRLQGLLYVTTYLVANWYYATTLVSVWCFFAAIVSLSLYVGLARKGG